MRKSSGQTLFSTIAAHGSILEANTWQGVLWQVLFPLLDNVIIQSDNASSERVSQSQVSNTDMLDNENCNFKDIPIHLEIITAKVLK